MCVEWFFARVGSMLLMMGMKVLPLTLWYGLLVLCPRGDGWFMLFVTWLCFLDPPALWLGEWVAGLAVTTGVDDVAQWPYTPGLLVKRVAFLGSLHWPVGCMDLGIGGISHVELPILYELWAGERLTSEKARPLHLRPGGPISVSAVPFGPGIDIWRSCRFIGAVMRSLCMLPHGLGWFVPCSFGPHHCRLRHFNWENCGHGLNSRPRESASGAFLDQLLLLFQYPPRSSRALLDGTPSSALPLRYCSTGFACSFPFFGFACSWSCCWVSYC